MTRRKRYRIKNGVRYIAYRTFNTYPEAMIELLTLRQHGVKAIIYNNYSKRNIIVFVKEVENNLEEL